MKKFLVFNIDCRYTLIFDIGATSPLKSKGTKPLQKKLTPKKRRNKLKK